MRHIIRITYVFSLIIILFAFKNVSAQPAGDPVYYEGEIYNTIIIANECWMTKNLNVGTMINGNQQPQNNGIVEKICFNNDPLMCDSFGGLYRWNEMMQYSVVQESQGICPVGWHIPSDGSSPYREWWELTNYYGNVSTADVELIVGGASGFNALLGGYANTSGGFYQQNIVGVYWSSTKVSAQAYRRVFNGDGSVERAAASITDAYSVRCVRNSLTDVIPFAITISGVNAKCNGTATGQVLLSVSGASNPSFLWSNGATVEDLIDVPAGSYSVTVTEGSQSLTESYTIGEPTVLALNVSLSSPILCYNGSNGILIASGSGGTPQYSYDWSTGLSGAIAGSLAAGTYFVTVTDANGCEAVSSNSLSNPSQLVFFTSVVSDLDCYNDNSGSINLTTQGIGPFLYNWSNYQVSQDISGLATGMYTVTVTKSGNCTVESFNITQPDLLQISFQTTNPSGQGLSDGSVDVTVTGGTQPYSYNWTNNATSQDLVNVPAGSYYVTVTDSNLCSDISDQITLADPGINLVNTIISDISCYGLNDGSIYFMVSGNSPFGFSLSNGINNSLGYFMGLSAGNYTVTVTDAIGGSAVFSNIIVSEPDQISVSVSQDAGCAGANLTVNANGGTIPYEYSKNGIVFQASNIFTNVSPGNYTIYVRDASSCETSLLVNVGSSNAMSVNGSITNPLCYGSSNGSIQLTVTNGVLPLVYNWSNGATTANLNNISSGTYWVTVTGSNGCSLTNSFTLVNPQNISITLTGSNITSAGGSDGSIQTLVSGGTPPYSYSWSNGATTQNISGLTAGVYYLTLTDNNQCVTYKSKLLIENLPTITITFNTVPVTCHNGNNGSITAIPTGGVAPYSFLWSNGATVSTISNLSPGSYSVTVSESGSNVAINSVSLSNPSLIAISVQSNMNYNGYAVSCFSCSDGQATATPSGGISPYTFLWSDGSVGAVNSGMIRGLHTVTVTDSNGCSNSAQITLNSPTQLVVSIDITSDFNGYGVSCPGASNGSLHVNVTGGVPPYSGGWSTGVMAYNLYNLPADSYSVTVTDLNSVSSVATVNLTHPDPVIISHLVTDVTYPGGNDGSVSLSLAGGVLPYSYNWSSGATTQTINNLSAGDYYVTVTDLNLCTSTDNATVIETISALTTDVLVMNVNCYGENSGSASVQVSGGLSPYTYLWSTGYTGSNIANLIAGTYFITVYDNSGDSVSESVVITEPLPIITNLAGVDISMPGGNDGSVHLSGSGGIPPYIISWSNGGSSINLTGLYAGQYFVTVEDFNGCLAYDSITLIELIPELVIQLDVVNIECFGFDNGSVNSVVSGGVPPYSFIWGGGETYSEINGLSAGEYYVTVYDSQNDSTYSSAIVLQPAELDVSVTSENIICYGENNGSSSLVVTGGVTPYSYFWSDGSSENPIVEVSSGTYFVLVEDANGCYVIETAIIDQPQPWQVSSVIVNASGPGMSDGSAQVLVTGNTAPYTYLWAEGETTSEITGKPSGLYNVSITDINNCFYFYPLEILEEIYGCMDPSALNYNPLATIDDGSCLYGQNVNQTVQAGVYSQLI